MARDDSSEVLVGNGLRETVAQPRWHFPHVLCRLGEEDPQPHTIAGARAWVLPNTSGLNANDQAADVEERLRALKRAVRRRRLTM